MMLPREHGAYSQMTLPLVTSFVTAGVSLPALLTGLAVILGFLAHEPLMVLLGRRGGRVRDRAEGGARTTLMIIGAAMIAVGIAAILLAPASSRLWFALPMCVAAAAIVVFAIAAARGALSWTPLIAIAPGLVAALSLAFQTRTPALKTIGWTLMSTSTAGAVVLMAGL